MTTRDGWQRRAREAGRCTSECPAQYHDHRSDPVTAIDTAALRAEMAAGGLFGPLTFRALLAKVDRLTATVARVEALADDWERTADAIAITYQNAEDREHAIRGHRGAVRLVRAALAEPTA